MKIAVLAAGGHTGRMVVDALRERGAEVVPLTRRDCDARDQASVEKAIAGADAMVNLAGPFLANGLAPVKAAIAARVPYVDTTGEQAFMADVRNTLSRDAQQAGVPIVNAVAFEYALGDLATRQHFSEGGKALHILYRPGAGASAGTKKSMLRVMAGPTMSYEDGALERIGAARHEKTFPTRDGPRSGVSFAGGEVLTVPTHTPYRTVRTYFATKNTAQARWLAPIARVALHGPVLALAERVVDARHKAPKNDKGRGSIHLLDEALGKHAVITTADPYHATGQIAAEGAMRVARCGKAGVLAPAVAFDAAEFLAALKGAMPGFHVDLLPSLS